jgi:hypothetical protein
VDSSKADLSSYEQTATTYSFGLRKIFVVVNLCVIKKRTKTMRKSALLTGVFTLLIWCTSLGQTQTVLPYFTFSKGLGITAPDSLFSMAIRFRIQNRAAFETVSESDLAISEVEARVHRDPGTPRRRQRRLAGTGQRRAVPSLNQTPHSS